MTDTALEALNRIADLGTCAGGNKPSGLLFQQAIDIAVAALSQPVRPEPVEGRLSFSTLRQANLSRCARWHPRGLTEWSLSDWGVATAGEMGEALNVVKKLNRERDGIAGNTASMTQLQAQLADEIADTAIYLDIMAASEGIDLGAAIASKFNRTSEKVGFPERLT